KNRCSFKPSLAKNYPEHVVRKYHCEQDRRLGKQQDESHRIQESTAIPAGIILLSGQDRDHHPADRALDLCQGKKQESIGPIIQAQLQRAESLADEHVVGIAREIVHDVETGHRSTEPEELERAMVEYRNARSKAGNDPDADAREQRSSERGRKQSPV